MSRTLKEAFKEIGDGLKDMVKGYLDYSGIMGREPRESYPRSEAYIMGSIEGLLYGTIISSLTNNPYFITLTFPVGILRGLHAGYERTKLKEKMMPKI